MTEKNLQSVGVQTGYRTGSSDLVRDFYVPCLLNSTHYDRAVGYFRSSIYALVGEAMIEFAGRGGRMRLVCSPDLEAGDIESIARGYERRAVVEARLLRDLEALKSVPWAESRLELLATLIALGTLDLRVAFRPDMAGIYHEKLGVFRDPYGAIVSFIGSSNETQPAWSTSGNYEAFEVFPSWLGGTDEARSRRHAQYFETLWNGDVPDLELLLPTEKFLSELRKSAKPDLGALRLSLRAGEASRRTLHAHQERAVREWLDQGCRGILQHATGSGKTLTALGAIRAVQEKCACALVVVPSRRLLRQWETEVRRELPEYPLLIAGDGRRSWRRPGALENFTMAAEHLPCRIVLSTLQTASKPEFRNHVRSGGQLLLIADEVHQVGSQIFAGLLTVDAGMRLGLSATPERFGDPDGTSRLLDYFGPILPTKFTLRDAIDAGRLVPYEYFPHTVTLTETEAEEYRRLTDVIARMCARQGTYGQMDERIRLLLLKRARIAKSAARKVPLATTILSENYQRGERWLVYCEDRNQLAALSLSCQRIGLICSEYYTEMTADSDATLRWLEEASGILLSIRCLDEGVDIPSISHALILASSQNPRQFIQRRGRVLRTAPGKTIATIHDLLVVPEGLAREAGQTALARTEILRALEFSRDAINRDAYTALLNIASEAGIDTGPIIEGGIEE